jgi:HAD superfamily hydrolase (TIGR01549 family)
MIRAVIFDVGGPLDLEIQHEAAIDADIRAGLEREGCEVDDAQYTAAEQRAVDSYAPNLYRALIWQLTGGNLEKSQRISDWREVQSAQRDLFELRPGIDAVLKALAARGLKLGLAANQPAAVIGRLAANGIGDYFENQGVSGVYGFLKPDVRLFLRTCEDLRVEPRECIMVGDRIDNDIVPAKHLGMKTVLFRTGRHRHQQARSWDEAPDAEVDSVQDLLPTIDGLLAKELP